jgi:DNA-binding transcriptional MerR regulator
MAKSSQAFRTIREVADWLDVAAHVLRFWESKFPQIKPVKRAGGRRYYRPADMELVGGIKVLLHDRGLTIRGVQKMISEDGVAAVAALSPPVDIDMDEVIEGDTADWLEDAAEDSRAEDARVAHADTERSVTPTPTPRPEPVAEVAVESDRQPQLALDMPPSPRPVAAPQAPEFGPALARLALRVSQGPALSPDTLDRLRAALSSLCDRMQAEPRV